MSGTVHISPLVTPEGALALLLSGVLYSDPQHVMLRELFQNALDSIVKRRALSPGGTTRDFVRVRYLRESESITRLEFVDSGIGLDLDTIREELAQPLRSFNSKRARIEIEHGNIASSVVGRYGMGLWTAFHISDDIRLETRPHGARHGYVIEMRSKWTRSRGHLHHDEDWSPENVTMTVARVDSTEIEEGTRTIICLSKENLRCRANVQQLDQDSVFAALRRYVRRVHVSDVRVEFECEDVVISVDDEPLIGESGRFSHTYRSDAERSPHSRKLARAS